MKIIQFEGPDGAGKTYFATRVAKKFNLPLQKYPSEYVYKRFDILGRDAFAKDYMCIGEIMYTRALYSLVYPFVVEDRGLLSSVVYSDYTPISSLIYEENTYLFLLLYVYEKKNEKPEDAKAEVYLEKYKKYADTLKYYYKKVYIFEKPPWEDEVYSIVERIIKGEE